MAAKKAYGPGGLPVVQTGPKGGKFHITATGTKSYTPVKPNSIHLVRGEMYSGAEINALAKVHGAVHQIPGYGGEYGAKGHNTAKAQNANAPKANNNKASVPVPVAPPKPTPKPKAPAAPKPAVANPATSAALTAAAAKTQAGFEQARLRIAAQKAQQAEKTKKDEEALAHFKQGLGKVKSGEEYRSIKDYKGLTLVRDLTEDKHAEAQVLKGMQLSGLAPLLAQHPVSISYEKPADPFGASSGLYSPRLKAITVKHNLYAPGDVVERKVQHYMSPEATHKYDDLPNLNHNVYRPAGLGTGGGPRYQLPTYTRNQDWQTGTLIHELGHHLHFSARLEAETSADAARSRRLRALDVRVGDRWRLARSDVNAVSEYARHNADEWFAETHLAYVIHKAELKEKRPIDYAVIRDMRLAMGVPE